MLAWLLENAGSLLVLALIAAAVSLIVGKLVRDRCAGRHCCGGDCSACRGCDKP